MVVANESSKLIIVRRASQPLARFSNSSSCDQPVTFPHRTILNGNASFSQISSWFCCYFCPLIFQLCQFLKKIVIWKQILKAKKIRLIQLLRVVSRWSGLPRVARQRQPIVDCLDKDLITEIFNLKYTLKLAFATFKWINLVYYKTLLLSNLSKVTHDQHHEYNRIKLLVHALKARRRQTSDKV